MCLLSSTTLESACATAGVSVAREELLSLLDASRLILSTANSSDEVCAGGPIFVACVICLFPDCFQQNESPVADLDIVAGEGLLGDVNRCLKRLQVQHCVAMQSVKLKPMTAPIEGGEARLPVWNSHPMEALLAAQGIACGLRLKGLLTACLALSRLSSPERIETIVRVFPLLWKSATVLSWISGAASLEFAEREFDEVLAAVVGGSTLGSMAQAALAALPQIPKQEPITRACAQPYVLCCALPVLPVLPLMNMELRRDVGLAIDEMLLFDSTEAPFADALRTACRHKLLHDHADGLQAMLKAALASLGSNDASQEVRLAVLKRFLNSPQCIAQLVERNKDLAVALFLLKSSVPPLALGPLRSEDFDAALEGLFQVMEIGEPLCHVVKSLADADELCQRDMETFVLSSVMKIDRDQSKGDDAKVQRGAKLVALLLNNLLLRRRDRIVSPEVEATLCDLLVRSTKIRECAELYGTLCTIRKVRSLKPSSPSAS